MTIAKIGLDISINSTGVSFILDGDEQIVKFFQIVPVASAHSASIQQLTYQRDWSKGNYSQEDLAKVNSAFSLSSKISQLLTKLKESYKVDAFDVRIEGSIMSQGFKKQQARVNDLTVFNGTVKLMLLKNELVQTITVVSPGALKKIATGKGTAKKEQIVKCFLAEFAEFVNIGKTDDIADAYYLAKFPYNSKLAYSKQ